MVYQNENQNVIYCNLVYIFSNKGNVNKVRTNVVSLSESNYDYTEIL